ncbi:sigma-70 family RNA polymerase sigma factor [Nafulsella turpanensis]|uniref:sigma-70 family RNA polymerase sigma factor n=1 Tax=Nafulsella turpanensis TaxID=1265690 RepID=UPI0003495515|nr:RNA polymerase sigma factor RpoD/SigA [Nafulsella turpanensis]
MRQLKITNTITNRDSATLEKYFNEVSKLELLTADEEVTLASRIKEGDQLALEKLVKANLRFVVSVAKQYHHSKVPLNDLINEGNLGLIKAAQMFDATKGFKFISYAVWWIRQSIMQALDNHSRMVRIPSNKINGLSKINQAISRMEQTYERQPTEEELAEFLELDINDIKNTNYASMKQLSLDAPFEEGEGNSLLDVLDDPDSNAAGNNFVESSSLKGELHRLLAVLSDREREILIRFFGIGSDYSQSLDDIADDLSLTRERVRQIKENALKKLRSKSGMKLLLPYLN